MGLTQKILLFTSALIIALTGITLRLHDDPRRSTRQQTVEAMLSETRGVWDTYQENRFRQLLLGCGCWPTTPLSRRESRPVTSSRSRTCSRNADRTCSPTSSSPPTTTGSSWLAVTGSKPRGRTFRKIRSSRAPSRGESATIWKQDGRFYHAVSVPMLFGPDLVGILIAGYAIDEPLANETGS